jgi:hypothetical protein
VAVGDLEHPGVDAREHAGEDVGREPLQVAHADVAEDGRDLVHGAAGLAVGRPAQAEAQVVARRAREVTPREHPVAVHGAPELEGRRAGHERPVEVEERGAAAGRPPLVLDAGRRREDVRALRHTRRMTASPWPPPEQIAAQP